MEKETRTMYFVMATDNDCTEVDFFTDEEQAQAEFDKACKNAHLFHFVTFVYLAAVEMSGTPTQFGVMDEDSSCWGLLKLERVNAVQCVAIDGKHGLRAGIDLTERLNEVADIINDEIQYEVARSESYLELEPGELRNMIDNEDTETYEEC